jgi:hypothetical protein
MINFLVRPIWNGVSPILHWRKYLKQVIFLGRVTFGSCFEPTMKGLFKRTGTLLIIMMRS